MNLEFSRHAQARVRQRGLREDDIAVILDSGTPVDDDSIFLLNQDVDREVRKLKENIAILERLRGCRVVVAGEKIITVYRPSRNTEKKLLRGNQQRSSCAMASSFSRAGGSA